MTHWSVEDIPDLTGKTAIVTGANSGIGLPTAIELARHGAEVVVAARNPGRGEAAVAAITAEVPDSSGRVTLGRLDLASLSAIERFAEDFASSHGHLDLLINNAGVVAKRGTTEDGFELIFGTNHLGHFALTARLFPLLRKQSAARVVNVSSDSHESAKMNFDDLRSERSFRRLSAYGRSKLANLLFTQELHRRVTTAGIDLRVAATNPAFTATNIAGRSPVLVGILRLIAKPPLAGALPSLYAATSPDVAGGDYVVPGKRTQGPRIQRAKPQAYSEEDAKRLWDISEELTGMPFPVS